MSAIGVLALQGGFAAHVGALEAAGVHPVLVRQPGALPGLSGLVLPGGESTTLHTLMAGLPWHEALRAFHRAGGALFGTCAGAILLAREVRPAQAGLGLLDVVVERNAYGRQAQSFEAGLVVEDRVVPGVFIRAPRIAATGAAVEVLARNDGAPVLVREGRVLAATFHPELAAGSLVHRLWLDTCVATLGVAGAGGAA